MINSRYIAVDWGTSHLRAYLCQIQPGAMGHPQVQPELQVLLQAKVTGPGVGKKKDDFAETLKHAIAPWLAEFGPLPVPCAST